MFQFLIISGVLSIALPVPVVVSNFEQFYQKELNRRKQEQDKKDEEKKKEKELKRLRRNSFDGLEDDEKTSMIRNGNERDSSGSPSNV